MSEFRQCCASVYLDNIESRCKEVYLGIQNLCPEHKYEIPKYKEKLPLIWYRISSTYQDFHNNDGKIKFVCESPVSLTLQDVRGLVFYNLAKSGILAESIDVKWKTISEKMALAY